MSSRLEEAARGYVETATALADGWRRHVDDVQRRIDDQGYGVNAAVADVTSTVALAAESWAVLAYEAIDAFSTLAAERPDRSVRKSDAFESPIAGARLVPAGPFMNLTETDELPAAAVKCEPEQLAVGQTTFRVAADASLRKSGLYAGKVRAEGVDATELIDVDIQVP